MHHADANIRRYDAVRDVLAANPDLAVDLAMHLEPDDDLIVIRLADELGAVVVHFVAGIGSRAYRRGVGRTRLLGHGDDTGVRRARGRASRRVEGRCRARTWSVVTLVRAVSCHQRHHPVTR